MSLDNLQIIELDACRPILITDADSNDVCEIYSDEDSTSRFPRIEAERLAAMVVAAPSLCAVLENLVDAVSSDREDRQAYARHLEAAEAILRRAYGGAAL